MHKGKCLAFGVLFRFLFPPRCPEACGSFTYIISMLVLAIRMLLLLYAWETETETSFNHEFNTVSACKAWSYLISMQPLPHRVQV